MELIQSDNKGCFETNRTHWGTGGYVFVRPDPACVVHANTSLTGNLSTSLLLPLTTYLLMTHEEWKLASTATPAPARTETSDAGVRASGSGCRAVNTGDGLGTILCDVHGSHWKENSDCAMWGAQVELSKSNLRQSMEQFNRDVRQYIMPPVAQVGGAHYQQQPGRVQHWDYAAGLLYCEGQVSRYLDRHAKPGGYGAKDVLKSLSYLLKILEVQYHDRWSENEDMLKDLQSRLADAYKTECAVPKRETVLLPVAQVSATFDDRSPVSYILYCPRCGKRHIDEGVWATRPHKKHLCTDDAAGKGCGHLFVPFSYPTVGVIGDAPLGPKVARRCTNGNCTKDALPGTVLCRDCSTDFS